MSTEAQPMYRGGRTALLRAAATAPDPDRECWPDVGDVADCRAWLGWLCSARPDVVEAIRATSPRLGKQIVRVHSGTKLSARQVKRATLSALRYALRATGRHTPFGLFAGIAPAHVGDAVAVRFGANHLPVAGVDTQWLAAVTEHLEARPALLAEVLMVRSNLAEVRGRGLETACGHDWVRIAISPKVAASIWQLAQDPVRFGDLVDKLRAEFPTTGPHADPTALLTELVSQGLLITSLRAPMTSIDPLGELLRELRELPPASVEGVAWLVDELRQVRWLLPYHNSTPLAGRAEVRATLTHRADHVSRELKRRRPATDRDIAVGRSPVAVNLRLDAEVTVPEHVAEQMEAAADTLMRLTRHPTGTPVRRDYYTRFCERYATHTLVPLLELVDPAAGLGFPAGYPNSVLPTPADEVTLRDEKLLALAWQAMADRAREIVLDPGHLAALTVERSDTPVRAAPHVELAARIHAADLDALARGDYLLTVVPGRSAGTLTSRFSTIAPDGQLAETYRHVPTAVDGALPVQLSFPPRYPHAQNISRVPVYLPHLLPLGEHRAHTSHALDPADLAVTATGDGLRLVELAHRRVVEPQAFHALDPAKQPPLARFLIHLSRALDATWTEFDWGPHAADLPYLPRVRHQRAILAPARWRLTTQDLPTHSGGEEWEATLARWRRRWGCPHVVELVDADRTLPLNLGIAAHGEILRTHLAHTNHAVLSERLDPGGWIDHRAHEIALPLFTTRPPQPTPNMTDWPVLTNRAHGRSPGSAAARWFNAKIHTHPQMLDELITELPELFAGEQDPGYWFIRYRGPRETDHLRLRIHTPNLAGHAHALVTVGGWAQRLREAGKIERLVVDTYHPETGRYGTGDALAAAERVFVADSHAVTTQLRHLPERVIPRRGLVALNMLATVHGFLGDPDTAIRWLLDRAAPGPLGPDRDALRQAVTFLGPDGPEVSGLPDSVARTWRTRAGALNQYRAALPVTTDLDTVLESLLHMHHNRLVGIDRAGETGCRRLARHAALAWAAHRRAPR